MSRRFVLGSGILFLVLLAVVLWTRPGREPARSEPLFTLKHRVPDTLTVAYGPDTTVLVPGGEAGWRVIAPVRYPADGVAVDALLKRLAPLPTAERRFPLLPENLDVYGLRYPQAMIRAAYRDSVEPDTLWIGTFTMNQTYDYVRGAGSPWVGLLDGRIARTYFLKSTHDLRRTRLLPFPVARAVRLVLAGEGGAPRLEAVRDPDGRWRLTLPYPGPGDSREILDYLTSLNHMHVREFLREHMDRPERYGLTRPRRKVTVVTEGGDRFVAVLGKNIPGRDEVYARVDEAPQLLHLRTISAFLHHRGLG